MKNHKLAQAISDMGWRQFWSMLEAKAHMYGRELILSLSIAGFLHHKYALIVVFVGEKRS